MPSGGVKLAETITCADTPGHWEVTVTLTSGIRLVRGGSAIWHSCVTLIVIPGPAVSIDFNWKKKAAHATRRLKQFEDGNPSSAPAGILSYPSTISPLL